MRPLAAACDAAQRARDDEGAFTEAITGLAKQCGRYGYAASVNCSSTKAGG